GASFALTSGDSLDAERMRRFGGRPAHGFPGAPTLADVARIPPVGFMARMLENAFTLPAGMIGQTPSKHAYVGVVVESDSVAHALYREVSVDGRRAGRVLLQDAFATTVMEVRREDGRWYVVPDWMLLARGEMWSMMPPGMEGQP
ncbi:MAG: hypothetical protein JO306_00600, partial [Gemmatimonadetes bacterium]|nr:hypothetical protein [Gemmatimonadota bacterium]